MANSERSLNVWLQRALPGTVNTHGAGIVALALFGFLAPQGHAGAKFGLLCLLLAALPHWRGLSRSLVRDPLFYAVSLLAVYLVARAGMAAHAAPGTAPEQWEATIELGLTGFCVLLVSWWLDGRPRRVVLLGAAAVVGLCVEILADLRLADLQKAIDGAHRHMVGSALPMALVGGVAMLATLLGAPVLVAWIARRSRGLTAAVAVLAVVMLALLAGLQVIAQSRAVIGMLTVLVPLLLLVELWRRRRNGRHVRAMAAVGAGVLIALSVTLAMVGPQLVDKMSDELDLVVPHVREGTISDVPATSLGWRVHLLVLGVDAATARPWLGWGPGTRTTKDLAERYDRARLTFLHHLHNTYLEIWVRLGVFGLLLYAAVVATLVRAAWVGFRQGRMPVEVATFVAASAVLMAGFSTVDFRLLVWDFRFPLIAVAAAGHTFGSRRATDAATVRDSRNPGFYRLQ